MYERCNNASVPISGVRCFSCGAQFEAVELHWEAIDRCPDCNSADLRPITSREVGQLPLSSRREVTEPAI
jgi:Zn finger protein HypA/HybF involved in hydrogenase expression